MKHPTVKRPPRSRWRRFWRWVRSWVDDLTRHEIAPGAVVPSYEDVKARAKR